MRKLSMFGISMSVVGLVFMVAWWIQGDLVGAVMYGITDAVVLLILSCVVLNKIEKNKK